MKIVGCDDAGLEQAAQFLRKGGLVVYPTDTVYGLGCDPYDPRSVKRVLEAKGRFQKPLPVLCSEVATVESLVDLTPIGRRLASKFWPGPLTLVCRLKDARIAREVTLGSQKLGVRVPNHACAAKLIDLSRGKIVGTSANRTGTSSPTNAQEALRLLGESFDILVDGGETHLKKESTVVDIAQGKVSVLREGYLKESEIENAL